jgi:hypothetical protein
MRDRFARFLLVARWASAIVALMYHVRFPMFVDYGAVHEKTLFSKAFYFLTGLGHESFAVFLVVDGVAAGLLLRHHARPVAERAAMSGYLGSLYRILLPGLIFGAAFDLAGALFFERSGVYANLPAPNTLTLSSSSLLGNLLMLQPFAVPTFGSNAMLYLLSYLFWSFVLLVLFMRAGRLGPPLGGPAQVLLATAVVLAMPYEFLVWGATWLAGVAVVGLAASRARKPSVPAALACFAGALLLSRLVGSDTNLLLAPFGDWLIRCKYLLVGISFALIPWALYPKRARARDVRAGQTASLAFFCHFPATNLFVAAGSVVLAQPIMQQPTPARYAGFACVVLACLATMALMARVSTALAAVRIRTPGSSYSNGRAPTQPTDCGD